MRPLTTRWSPSVPSGCTLIAALSGCRDAATARFHGRCGSAAPFPSHALRGASSQLFGRQTGEVAWNRESAS